MQACCRVLCFTVHFAGQGPKACHVRVTTGLSDLLHPPTKTERGKVVLTLKIS